jgi:hypothetical protein
MQKRLSAILLAVVMLITVMAGNCASVFASEGDTVSVYFMARGVNAEDKTPVVSYECTKLTVPADCSVADVTEAVNNGSDEVVSGSGLSWYNELFGQASGLTSMYSGWMYYVDSYDYVPVTADQYTVKDGMFILWEYVSDFDENWNAVITDPVDFEAEKAKADNGTTDDGTTDDGTTDDGTTDGYITVYFMARGASTTDNTVHTTLVEPIKLKVNKGVTVSDITAAMSDDADYVVSGSGLAWYDTLFGQGSGLTSVYSGWSYYVDDYSYVSFLSNEYVAEDNMFILWDYTIDFDENWNTINNDPVDFSAARESADKKLTVDITNGVLRGDATNDGIVTASDAAFTLQKTLDPNTEINEGLADINRDGVLTANDAALILGIALNV